MISLSLSLSLSLVTRKQECSQKEESITKMKTMLRKSAKELMDSKSQVSKLKCHEYYYVLLVYRDTANYRRIKERIRN